MRIALVSFHQARSPQAVPLAAAFLKSAACADEELSSRCDIRLFDFYPEDSPESAARLLADWKPGACGISLYVWNRKQAAAFAVEVKRLLPGVVIFGGGPEATGDPAGLLANTVLDFAILGEGEETFPEVVSRLLAGHPVEDLRGTAWRSGGEVRIKVRPPVPLPDTIPSPVLNRVLDLKDFPGFLWQLSRGCPFGCDFCLDSPGGRTVRHFSLERVEAELAEIGKACVPQVFVLDSTFNVDLKRAKRILRMIARVAPHVHFHFEARGELLDGETARLFAEILCSVQIGLQSVDPGVLRGVGRTFDREAFQQGVMHLNREGVIFGFDLIYGLPGDSCDGFLRTLDFALALYPNHLDIFPLALLPGTVLAAKAGSLGISHLPEPPYTVLSTPSFTEKDLAQAARVAAACDIFYNRGKSVAWFLPVARGLGMGPAELLEEFAAWLERRGTALKEEDLSDEAILLLQTGFLKELFPARKRKKLLAVALDLAEYHHLYAAALMAPAPELPTDRDLERRKLLNETPRLAPSARMARFRYEILEILETGEMDLEEFHREFRPDGSCAVVYPRGEEVATESLAEPFYLLLESLDGRTPAGKAAKKVGLSAEEAREFLDFAWSEGIVTY